MDLKIFTAEDAEEAAALEAAARAAGETRVELAAAAQLPRALPARAGPARGPYRHRGGGHGRAVGLQPSDDELCRGGR